MHFQEDANVIIVGWGEGANSLWYPTSASNSRTIGAEIALIINRLKSQASMGTNVWCIGYSLGSHVCGFTGMITDIDRITGKDIYH